MAGSINQIQLIDLSVSCSIWHSHSLALDGDTPFLLDIHIIENLGLYRASCLHQTSPFDEPVGKSALAVVNMRNDAEVSLVACVYCHLSPQVCGMLDNLEAEKLPDLPIVQSLPLHQGLCKLIKLVSMGCKDIHGLIKT